MHRDRTLESIHSGMRSFESPRPCDYMTLRGRLLFCRNGGISLEAEAKRKLDRAWSTDLKEWTQLTHHVARTEPRSERLGGGAKARTGSQRQPTGSGGTAGIGEVEMIEDVERFRAELQAKALG
jgi:hypothetical protein